MITNKDISIDSENGKITLNGNKYDLGTQGEIDTAVKAVYSVMGQMGAKNLFNSQYSVPRTNIGTTATLGDDGHIIINGTANADGAQLNQSFESILPIYDLKVGDKLILSYKVISGTFTHGSSSSKTGIYLNDKNGHSVPSSVYLPSSLSTGDSGSSEVTLNADCFDNGVLKFKNIQMYLRNGDTFNNLELAIMLRLASDTDDTYEPYAMTNKQLTDQVEEVGTQIENLIKYKDVTLNTSTNGYEAPSSTAGGVSIEALASYEALGVSRDKILGIIPIDWSSISQPLSFYLGGTSVKAMLHGSTSIYTNSSLSYVNIRVVYHS